MARGRNLRGYDLTGAGRKLRGKVVTKALTSTGTKPCNTCMAVDHFILVSVLACATLGRSEKGFPA